MFHDDHSPINDPSTQALLLSCPICRREVCCELRQTSRERYLSIPSHGDCREAMIEQPECPATGGRFSLVYAPASTIH